MINENTLRLIELRNLTQKEKDKKIKALKNELHWCYQQKQLYGSEPHYSSWLDIQLIRVKRNLKALGEMVY